MKLHRLRLRNFRGISERECVFAERGVTVRMITDWWGTGRRQVNAMHEELTAGGVEHRMFNPWFKRGVTRTHRKICVVDREVAYVGGININDDMFCDYDHSKPLSAPRWDFAVQVRGPLVADIQLEAVTQPEEGVNYASKISKDEAALDFSQSAVEISRKIRAFNPFPGAHGTVNGVNVKLWGAEVLDGGNAAAGSVLSADAQHGIVVACGTGALRLTQLQKPGGKRLPAAEFIKGFPLEGLSFI